ncbi:MAG: rhomboid family intramembrane serine protease [Flavobacteriales bacterium]|nr:rhomboid family intramembrane serine protease [Flavobacteriales bacterium]
MSIAEELKSQWRSGSVLMRLILINVALFLLIHAVGMVGWLTGQGTWDGLILEQLVSSNQLDQVLRKPWTVITYMFTHFDPGHIIWNMLILFFSGRLFMEFLGPKRMLGNYLLGGIAGLFMYWLATLGPAHLALGGAGVIMGASACVMGVLIGIASYRPDYPMGMMFVGVVPLKYVALVIVIIDLISVRTGGNTGGHLAHIGGALYGFLAAQQLKRGNDWSLGFVNFLEKLLPFGKKRPSKLRVEKSFVGKTPKNDTDYNANKRAKQARVDTILDKISRSGYDSLSKEEKDFLFKASDGK